MDIKKPMCATVLIGLIGYAFSTVYPSQSNPALPYYAKLRQNEVATDFHWAMYFCAIMATFGYFVYLMNKKEEEMPAVSVRFESSPPRYYDSSHVRADSFHPYT